MFSKDKECCQIFVLVQVYLNEYSCTPGSVEVHFKKHQELMHDTGRVSFIV